MEYSLPSCLQPLPAPPSFLLPSLPFPSSPSASPQDPPQLAWRQRSAAPGDLCLLPVAPASPLHWPCLLLEVRKGGVAKETASLKMEPCEDI